MDPGYKGMVEERLRILRERRDLKEALGGCADEELLACKENVKKASKQCQVFRANKQKEQDEQLYETLRRTMGSMERTRACSGTEADGKTQSL